MKKLLLFCTMLLCSMTVCAQSSPKDSVINKKITARLLKEKLRVERQSEQVTSVPEQKPFAPKVIELSPEEYHYYLASYGWNSFARIPLAADYELSFAKGGGLVISFK